MDNISFLQDYVKTYKGQSPRGCACRFIRLNDKFGIKCYRTSGTRDLALERQQKMAKCGYAPNVGIAFDLDNTFCYVTEIAEPLVEGNEYYDEHYYECSKRIHEKHPDIDTRIEHLVEDMAKAGYPYPDVHYANFGILNSNLVCIDFS